MILLTDRSSSGVGEWVDWKGTLSEVTVHLWGTMDGCTVTLECSPHSSSTVGIPVNCYHASSAGAQNIRLRTAKIRGKVVGAGSATSVSLVLR